MEPIYVYSIAITAISIIFVYYLFQGVVKEEHREYITIQSYDEYGETKEIRKLPLHFINIVKRTRIISKFSGSPQKEIVYIIEVKPMSHTNIKFKRK